VRRAAAVVVLAVSLLWLSTVAWPPGLTATWPYVGLLQATVFVAAVGAVFGIGLLSSFARAGAFALVALLLVVVVPRVPAPFLPDANSSTLRVVALNTYFQRAEDAQIVERLEELDPDVVILSETSPEETAAVIEGTGLVAADVGGGAGAGGDGGDLAGGAGGDLSGIRPGPSGAEGVAILVRPEQDYSSQGDLGLTQFQMPSVLLGGSGGSGGLGKRPAGTQIVGAHPLTPMPDTVESWDQGLQNLGGWIDEFVAENPTEEAESASKGLVVAGDFNATRAHPRFRALGIQDCTGHLAHTPTWPAKLPVLRLDHILTTGQCHDGGQFRVAGTDHRGVWADITP